MIASPVRILQHILLALLVFLYPFTVVAQPVELRPQEQPTATTPDPSTPVEENQEDTAITSRTLEAVDPDEFGLIGADEGAFDLDLWQGTNWPFVKAMMQRIPGVTTSAIIRSLSSRLLLSGGRVPSGKPPSESFVGLRIDRLLALADTESALQLIKAVPGDQRSDALTHIEADTLFLHNRNAEGCASVRSVNERSGASYWRQALSFCFTLDGNYTRAAMIADLLREREDGVDPTFFDIIDALGGLQGVEISSISHPTGLVLAMIRASSLRVPQTLGISGAPAILRWIARAPNADIDLRVDAAERSLVGGLIAAGEILSIYGGVPFTPDELTDPAGHAAENWGPRARALLVHIAAAETTPPQRAKALQRALELGRERGGYHAIALASAPIVSAITPQADLLWFSREAARALLTAGRFTDGLAWYQLAASNRELSDEATAAEDDLWPLAALASEGVGSEPLGEWYSQLKIGDEDESARKAILLLSFLESLGRSPDKAHWLALAESSMVRHSPTLNRAWSRSLEEASTHGRVGETVLLIVVGAGVTGGYFQGSAAADAIAALRRIGLEEEARQLALESALAAGL